MTAAGRALILVISAIYACIVGGIMFLVGASETIITGATLLAFMIVLWLLCALSAGR